MYSRKYVFLIIIGLLGVAGCESPAPKDILKPDASVLQNRSLQSRTFNTGDEKAVLSASAAALQDLGFTIDESETKLGLIVASKDADATDKTQVALAATGIVLNALAGTYDHSMYANLDDVQKVKASLVTHANAKQDDVNVRITFQRVVWNKNKQISKMETLHDQKLYQGFFERLSKSVFLEDHKV